MRAKKWKYIHGCLWLGPKFQGNKIIILEDHQQETKDKLTITSNNLGEFITCLSMALLLFSPSFS